MKVAWKKSTLLTTLTKGTRFARNYKPPKPPKTPKAPKPPKMPKPIKPPKQGTMRMVEAEPELPRRPWKDTGIYKQKRRWF